MSFGGPVCNEEPRLGSWRPERGGVIGRSGSEMDRFCSGIPAETPLTAFADTDLGERGGRARRLGVAWRSIGKAMNTNFPVGCSNDNERLIELALEGA